MTAQELLAHIEANVKTFTNCKLLGAGVAYHYTSHLAAIEARDGFLGAPIDGNLDQTQFTIPSKPAEHDPGVMFAYADEKETRLEGKKCDIIRIAYSAAVEATHAQENAWDDAPPTVLILTTDIMCYKKMPDVAPKATTPLPTPPTAPPRSTP